MSTIVALVGATATGKSAVALAAAEACGAEIVNADALQVYRDLDIGTAKPSREERRRVPHHLVDILDPRERFSAGEFARRARAALAEIAARGRPAIVVGGSGLYLRALWAGLAAIPDVDESARRELEGRLRSEGLPILRRELLAVDPATAARIGRNDTQRILRALTVALSTGKPLSAWLTDAATENPAPKMRRFGLTLPRAVLYDRIAARVQRMTDGGWLSEVRGLLTAGVSRDAPALQAIGYSDWIRYLDGETSSRETVDAIVRATRRYAKRQETWFRREPEIEWLSALDDASAIAALRKSLDVGEEER
ncbi:MAG TPA: tRNA (adenosine(37)-N6)-dimethylallyltransferase MiaA [Thermoanaerobaculia bacterium]